MLVTMLVTVLLASLFSEAVVDINMFHFCIYDNSLLPVPEAC